MALSDTKIRSIKPSDKPYKLADGGGLYLLINPSGGKLGQKTIRRRILWERLPNRALRTALPSQSGASSGFFCVIYEPLPDSIPLPAMQPISPC